MTDHSLLFLFYELTFLILNAIKRTSSKQNHNDSTNKQTKKNKKNPKLAVFRHKKTIAFHDNKFIPKKLAINKKASSKNKHLNSPPSTPQILFRSKP